MGWASEQMIKTNTPMMCDANGKDSFDRAFEGDIARAKRNKKDTKYMFVDTSIEDIPSDKEPLKENVKTMPFGKHKGKSLDEVPRGYLRWVKENFGKIKDPVLNKYLNNL